MMAKKLKMYLPPMERQSGKNQVRSADHTQCVMHHTKIQIQSLNPDYKAIDVSPEDASSLLTVGILRAVL